MPDLFERTYTAYVRTADNSYQIQPTTSLTTLNNTFKKVLKLLIQSGELTKEQAAEQHHRLKLLIDATNFAIKEEISNKSKQQPQVRKKRAYVRRAHIK